MKLNTIKRIFDELNESQFANVLEYPRFFATRSRSTYAQQYFNGYEQILEFNLKYIRWVWARSIVYHEMIHLYIDSYLEVEELDHHGPIFWKEYRKWAPTNVILFEALK